MKPVYTIPTGYKDKIPHTFSYSIGAERISEALQEVPQIKDLCVYFSGFNCAKNLREGGKVNPVLEVQYTYSRPGLSSSNSMIEDGWYRPRWKIYVRPVRRELKHIVMELLLEEGLPRVREWLVSRKALAGREAFHRLTFHFDEHADKLNGEEYFHM
jgi:hypothetical protein